MSSNKVIKSVSFNETNPLDALMLKAIKRRNFSGYVKRLIAADIKAKEVTVAIVEPVKLSEDSVVYKEVYEDVHEDVYISDDIPATPEKPPQAAPVQSTTDKLAQLKRNGINGPKLFGN
ncbi:hypothetical protein I2483_13945 [Sporosarcina sp. E16_3]|uniref:hypothetical protein n=1 Tax=Sporosarcina sp. E16_3 TaxID=2789293 RepID=UPI001A9287ED|nr:hypothetical protein [Sporosarcina sp. E16_3]MBO0602766.1 hypothetical protein [Sporosarcina sp. E16_3]